MKTRYAVAHRRRGIFERRRARAWKTRAEPDKQRTDLIVDCGALPKQFLSRHDQRTEHRAPSGHGKALGPSAPFQKNLGIYWPNGEEGGDRFGRRSCFALLHQRSFVIKNANMRLFHGHIQTSTIFYWSVSFSIVCTSRITGATGCNPDCAMLENPLFVRIALRGFWNQAPSLFTLALVRELIWPVCEGSVRLLRSGTVRLRLLVHGAAYHSQDGGSFEMCEEHLDLSSFDEQRRAFKDLRRHGQLFRSYRL